MGEKNSLMLISSIKRPPLSINITILQSKLGSSSNEIELKERLEVLLYRITLIVASMTYAANQLSKILIGSGLTIDTIDTLGYTSQGIFAWGMLLCALFSPQYAKNDKGNLSVTLLNKSLPILASF